MKDAQDAVDRVLRGLREVEAPAGLEQRVLRGVEARALAGERRGWFEGLLFGGRGWAGAALGAGALLAAVCGVVAWMQMGVGRRPIAPISNGREVSRAVVAPEVSVSAIRPVEDSAPVGRRRSAVRVRKVDAEFDAGSEAVALEEMRAPSMPAPPLPLTREERLLLRVVKTGAPEEIAMLDAAQRERTEAKGQEEFQSFFEPPKPKTQDHE